MQMNFVRRLAPAFIEVRSRLATAIVTAALMAGGCSSSPPPLAATGSKAYDIIPAATADPNGRVEYMIGSLDVLSISVFQEKDLSIEEVPVDASGSIIFPLIGQVQVAGKSSSEVAQLIASRLGERFLVNPQVSVLVKTSVSQKVTVDGEVKEPGVYPLQGDTTLMQAVAMAKGATGVASVDKVIVFRTVGDTRYAALFDLAAIRSGRGADPQIRANDVVYVGLSRRRAFMRDLVALAPTLTTAFVAVQQITNR